MNSEIVAALGLDSSKFNKGLTDASSRFSSWGKSLGRQSAQVGENLSKGITEKYGAKGTFSAISAAIGLNIQAISKSLAELFTGGSQDAWQAGLKAAEESARVIEEATLRRMTTVQQIAALERTIANRRGDENATPRKTDDSLIGRALDWMGKGSRFSPITWGAKLASVAVNRESEADAFARSQQAQAQNLVAEQRIAALKEQQARDEERIAAARADLALLGADDAERVRMLTDEVSQAYDRLAEAVMKQKPTTDLQLAALGKIRALKMATLEIDKRQTEEAKRQREEREAELKAAREAELKDWRRYFETQDRRSSDMQDLRDARHDAVAFTVSEAASGARGNTRDRERANAIQRDEQRAKRLYDTGATVVQFDERTQRNEARDFRFFQKRALDLREMSPRLTTTEQRPFGELEKKITESNVLLKEIRMSLVRAPVKR